MLKIIKFHKQIFLGIRQHLKTLKTNKQKRLIIQSFIKSYFNEMIYKKIRQLIINLNISSICARIKARKVNKVIAEFKRGIKFLQYLDKLLEAKGLNRTARRQFWNDFRKFGVVRKEIFENLLKGYNINDR